MRRLLNWWTIKKRRVNAAANETPAESNFVLSNGDYLTLSDGSLLEIVA